ncbi:Crp/Fnr family transcriptional regulator [Gemmatimonadota bacterium]
MGYSEKVFRKGESIIKEGHYSDSFYVIKTGKVDVVKQKGDIQVMLNQLGPKEFFGELNLLDPEVRKHSVTIRAADETTVIIMEKEDFEGYLGHLTPGTKNLLLKMARRLREADDKIAELTKSGAK